MGHGWGSTRQGRAPETKGEGEGVANITSMESGGGGKHAAEREHIFSWCELCVVTLVSGFC